MSAKTAFPCKELSKLLETGLGYLGDHESAYYRVLQALEWWPRSEKRAGRETEPFFTGTEIICKFCIHFLIISPLSLASQGNGTNISRYIIWMCTSSNPF